MRKTANGIHIQSKVSNTKLNKVLQEARGKGRCILINDFFNNQEEVLLDPQRIITFVKILWI